MSQKEGFQDLNGTRKCEIRYFWGLFHGHTQENSHYYSSVGDTAIIMAQPVLTGGVTETTIQNISAFS